MKTKEFFKVFFIIFLLLITISSTCYAEEDLNLSSEAAILIEASTGKVLYDKNSTQKMYPASTTKILTAIIAIENCELDDVVTVNYNAISTIPSGYSIAELMPDEELTVKQLLDVLLVHSANDAANVLAMHIGGSIESFVSMMNSKANEIGCTNSNFTNAYGLQDENHYTTAYDLALIAKYCMSNNVFRSFVSQPSCTVTATNKHDTRKYVNTNDLINKSSKYYYEYAIGGKTGYTSEAKNCLVSVCNKDGLELIGVVLGSKQTEAGLSARYLDSIAMFEDAYSKYSIQKIANKNDVITQVNVSKATKETKNLDIILSDDILAMTNSSTDINDIHPAISIDGNLSAPISAGSVIGKVTYSVDGIDYSTDLLAGSNVEKSDFMPWLLRIILIVLILITLLILIYNFYSRNKKNVSYNYRYY